MGISRDDAKSHRGFIEKHGLGDLTLLTDKKGKISKKYDTDHWLLPVSRRVYIIINKDMKILYRKDTGFGLLENQTRTLIREIESNIP